MNFYNVRLAITMNECPTYCVVIKAWVHACEHYIVSIYIYNYLLYNDSKLKVYTCTHDFHTIYKENLKEIGTATIMPSGPEERFTVKAPKQHLHANL